MIEEARKGCKTFHFPRLLDICHLDNRFQKCKGRLVRHGAVVTDDSGSYPVFTVQGSLPRCAGQASDAVSAYNPCESGWRSEVMITRIRVPNHLDSSTTAPPPKISGRNSRESGTDWKKCVRTHISRIPVGPTKWLGKPRKKLLSLRLRGRCKIGWEEEQPETHVGWNDETSWSRGSNTCRKIKCTWDVRRMNSSRIWKFPQENKRARISDLSRYCQTNTWLGGIQRGYCR